MSICTADAPRTRSDPNEFKNAVVASPVAKPKVSTTPPRRLSSAGAIESGRMMSAFRAAL